MSRLWQAAQAEKLLLLVHSGNSWNCSADVDRRSREQFPKANFVIAHSAGFEGHQEAIVAARHQDNLYFDTASNGYPDITTNVVRALGPERVVYGSDHPTLPFGFETRQDRQIRRASIPISLDLILGKISRGYSASSAKPSAPKTMDVAQI